MGDSVLDDDPSEPVPHASRVSVSFPPETASVPGARRFVDRALPQTCWADEVTLLVSELASNAVRHARLPFTVTLECDGSKVRVEVSDDDARIPHVQHPAVDAVTGRGLLIVDAIADDWGTEPTATGKVVWFELACRTTVTDEG